jgi:hypothetical protein
MGGYINVGYRGKNGDVRNALAYTSDLTVFPLCAQFLSGDETRVAALIDKQTAAKDYGPYISAPYSYGYRFADFQTRTLFDMQNATHTLGITWGHLAFSIVTNDGVIQELLRSIRSVTKTRFIGDPESCSVNLNDYEHYDIEIPPVRTLEELFEACGFSGFPEYADFFKLNVDPGDWKIRTFAATAVGATRFRDELASIVELTPADNRAWDALIIDWESREHAIRNNSLT